MSQRTLAS
jgi:hypothetical protein